MYTLMREIRLPERFDLGEGYGKTSWNVRAIWENYAGWFHHRSTTELYGVPASDVASDVVATAGAAALVAAARARLNAGDPVAALHLTDLVLAAVPGDADARSGGRSGQPAPARLERQLLGACMARPDDPPPGGRVTNQLSFDFTDTEVLVTGGTSGIGFAVASAFADDGATVTVTGRRAKPDEYETDLARFGYRQAEMTDRESVDALVSSLDHLDVLVNNAGANFPGGRDEWEPDTFAAALSLNLGRADAAHRRLPTPARREHDDRWGVGDQHDLARRVPLDPHRPRLRLGESGAGHPHRKPRRSCGAATISGSTGSPPGSSRRR